MSRLFIKIAVFPAGVVRWLGAGGVLWNLEVWKFYLIKGESYLIEDVYFLFLYKL